MYNEHDFIEKLLYRAGKMDLYQEAKAEIELFRKNNKVEYLFFVSELVKLIKERFFEYPLIRMSGGSSICAYILGIHTINPTHYEISNMFFFNRHYENDYKPRFDISVPSSKIDETIKALKELTNSDVEDYKSGLYCFGEKKQFIVGIYGSNYLERCLQSLNLVISLQDGHACYEEDCATIKYMLEKDYKGFILPNLSFTLIADFPTLYEYMELKKPKNLDELAKLICLSESTFYNKELVLERLGKDGLKDLIFSKEQTLSILKRYEIDEDRAFVLLDTLFKGSKLFESDKLLLESNGVPEDIINQLENVKYLSDLSFALQEVKIAYQIAYCKTYFEDEFEDKIIATPYAESFVGPFFYIGGRIMAHKDSMRNFNKLTRFFDDPLSHFDYFESLGIDGDYGNYPRGRVIYNNYHKEFYVYLDKYLNNKDIKEMIKTIYCLKKGKVVFKRDIHYTHDGL